jgi:hypothetical protein
MTQADQRMSSRQELRQHLKAAAKRRAQRVGSDFQNAVSGTKTNQDTPNSAHNAVLTTILETIIQWSVEWPAANDADLAAALRRELTLKIPLGEAARDLNARWRDIGQRLNWNDRTILPLFRKLAAMHEQHRGTGNPTSMIGYLQTLVS